MISKAVSNRLVALCLFGFLWLMAWMVVVSNLRSSNVSQTQKSNQSQSKGGSSDDVLLSEHHWHNNDSSKAIELLNREHAAGKLVGNSISVRTRRLADQQLFLNSANGTKIYVGKTIYWWTQKVGEKTRKATLTTDVAALKVDFMNLKITEYTCVDE